MAYKYREEIVGKRFLCVSGFTNLKLRKINEWNWRAGVIRAASHKDTSHQDLQVLVEYDDVEWHRREWISIYKDRMFHAFLVEHSLFWAKRQDPLSSSGTCTALWPALSFTALVAHVDMASNQQPLEFLLDRELVFRDCSRLQPFQEWDPKLPGLRDYPELRSAVRSWSEMQDGQRILMTTPSVLVGYRVEVYRAEGTTQWYTAVIVSYNESTRDLTVTDDTVLEDHNEDPCIIQMRLIGDGVVESIMRGEDVGITPRRSRSSAVLQVPFLSRVAGSSSVTRKLSAEQETPESRKNKKKKSAEDLENKGNKKKSTNRGGKKKVLEEANCKLRRHVQVRVEDCLLRKDVPEEGCLKKSKKEALAVPAENCLLKNCVPVDCLLRSCRRETASHVKEKTSKHDASSSPVEDCSLKFNIKETRLSATEDCSLRSCKKEATPSPVEDCSRSCKKQATPSPVEDSSLRSCKKETTPEPIEGCSLEFNKKEGTPSPVEDSSLISCKKETTTEPVEDCSLRFNKKEATLSPVEDKSSRSYKKETTPEPIEDYSLGFNKKKDATSSPAEDSSLRSCKKETTPEPVEDCSLGFNKKEATLDPVEDSSLRSCKKGTTPCPIEDCEKETTSKPVEDCSLGFNKKETTFGPVEPLDVRHEANGVVAEDDTVILEARRDEDDAVLSSSSPLSRMESGTTLLRFADDRSDSGVSSLRSGSGDERSGSRSSALSSSDEQNQLNSVWRDPSLLLAGEPQVRHINSVQHHSLLMSHTPQPAVTATPATSSSAAALALAQAHYPPPPPLLSPHHLHHHPHAVPHLPPPGLYPDMLWNKRYPPLPVGTHLLAPAHPNPEEFLAGERDRVYRERQSQEAARELEKQQKERERQEREKMERDQQEREKMEKQRAAEQAVHRHFEESLRLANQKRNNVSWSLINSLPPPHRGSGAEEERKHDVTQQRLMTERLRQQERYYAPGVQRPPGGPPPAHRKTSEKPSSGHPVLPKAEPNFNLFGYPAYHPGGLLPHDSSKVKQVSSSSTLVTTKSAPAPVDLLPNPPPLMSDIKNSVIVKNEVKHEPKVPPSHSPSPKLVSSQQQQQQHYKAAYEYRSPTQSPHHIASRHTPSPHHTHMLEPQNLVGKSLSGHHRTSQQSPPEQRYGPSPLQYGTSKTATVGSYPYPSPHYALVTGGSVTASSKPKVSSPAPPHFYGKPGITTGTPVCRAQDSNSGPLPLTSKAPLTSSVSPSPYQQMSPHHPPPPPHQATAGPPPPPAHSRGLYERLYAGGPGLAVKPPPQHQGSSPPSASAAPRSSPLFQTQPLDLGVGNNRDDMGGSPKRKGVTAHHSPGIDASKKRRCEQPQPLLSRVSEPSPLIASAATTITTVVNTAAYCTPAATTMMVTSHEPLAACTTVTTPARTESGDGSVRPSSTCSSPGITAVFPSSSPSLQITPVKPPPSSVDSDKSNSPGPVRPTTVHKLKKAWLQRHSGEDGTEDTTGIVGSGSCVTLPLNLGTNTALAGSSLPSLQNKAKTATNKGNSRKSPAMNKEGIGVTLNGHAADIPSSKLSRPEDSSSSDAEREHKSLPKRKPPKMKRKKGGGAARKAAEEKRKKLVATAVHSESGSDSDKESVSDKDSDSGHSGASGKKSANGGGGSSTGGGSSGSKEPRKRGRRPKSSKNDRGEEPRQKKSRDDPPTPQRDPFRKPPISQLKKTGESFLQDGPCHEVAPKLAKCRECRWTPNQRSKNMPNIFCRFYAFRRLRYTKNGQLAIAGFSDPHRDAAEEDVKLWLPIPDNPPADLDLEMSRFLLAQVGDQFCDLLEQEKESLAVHMSEERTIAWKRVVQGVREMCDVCETTLFNFHWACNKCGFVVCIDCYKGRKNGSVKIWGEAGKDRDDFSWLLCTNRQAHEQEKLMLTQIIAGDSLLQLGRKVHEARALWNIPQCCGCPMSKDSPQKTTNGICKDLLKVFKIEPLNGLVKQEEDRRNGAEEQNSPLNWLADVALSSEDKKPCEDSVGSSSDSDEDKEGNYSTLRELLIRPSHKPNSNGSRSASPANTTKSSKKSRLDTLDEVISSVIEHSVQKEEQQLSSPTASEPKPSVELKHFVRRFNWGQKGREPLPIRIMTLTESKMLYPDVSHAWLCDGKLLRLNDPNCEGNYRIFQDQWKRGQPVIVSDVTKHLDMSLWHPESFARDFGEDKNDLINCMTGNLVPNQPMRKFWEGFEHFSRRLKDDRGNPMLLKLKDWPPGEDFAEMLPSRFSDLMKVLPLAEYTHRTGRLNLASRLPDCFVRPDLGPKMYNAYGSALYPSKGTTNLHLDISDAVNVMVYVGIPKDGDSEEHIKEAFRAIDEAGCDILTRRRVREKGELPGALWHIYNARDADKIRDLLNKAAIEKGARLEPHHDPIHDQSWYLDGPLRERLYKEYGVEGYAIVQCLGDAVFIPAGAPHQVRNLHNCIKVAEDFVSPENVSHCFHLTQEFRELSDTHSNHEDKLQIKNIIYHAVKDSLSVLAKVAGGSEEFLASESVPAIASNEEEEEAACSEKEGAT